MIDARCVIDTNVWLSFFLFGNPTIRVAVALLSTENFQVVASSKTLDEFRDVLKREKFHLPAHIQKEAWYEVQGLSEIISVTTSITASRDPRDDKFLELSVDGKADFLVTGDKDLLDLANNPDPAWTFQIVTPGAFLEAVGKN